MDFPPVSNLINNAFDQLNQSEHRKASQPPVDAPQPVADTSTGGDAEALGMNSPGQNGTNRVGTILSARA